MFENICNNLIPALQNYVNKQYNFICGNEIITMSNLLIILLVVIIICILLLKLKMHKTGLLLKYVGICTYCRIIRNHTHFKVFNLC